MQQSRCCPRIVRAAPGQMSLTSSAATRKLHLPYGMNPPGGTHVNKLLRSLLFALALSPLVALAEAPVDVNTADAAALETVKGIGPARAKAIIEYRKANGAFASVDDLTKVPGIGDKSVTQLREQLTVGSAKKQVAKSK
ncbi:ComEA-related competence protein [Aromatoleum bremense]|nr:ComEA-related competence protein [Aromatoleum bremense]